MIMQREEINIEKISEAGITVVAAEVAIATEGIARAIVVVEGITATTTVILKRDINSCS